MSKADAPTPRKVQQACMHVPCCDDAGEHERSCQAADWWCGGRVGHGGNVADVTMEGMGGMLHRGCRWHNGGHGGHVADGTMEDMGGMDCMCICVCVCVCVCSV